MEEVVKKIESKSIGQIYFIDYISRSRNESYQENLIDNEQHV